MCCRQFWTLPSPPASRSQRQRPIWALHDLAGWAEARGTAPVAYNAMSLVLGCGTRHDADREALARIALRLAEDAGKPHQIAVCAAAVASAVALAAVGSPERRLEAFDACEYAIQRIARTSKAQLAAAAELGEALEAHDFLGVLRPGMWFAVPQELRPAAVKNLPNVDLVTSIVDHSSGSAQDWLNKLLAARTWEIHVENARLAFEPPAPACFLETDWFTFAFEHPSYRRAVPHSSSILKEEDSAADELLVAMAHEITHVVCLIGGVGYATTALKIATQYIEIAIWKEHLRQTGTEGDPASLLDHGVAPLNGANFRALFPAELALDLTRKMQILHDVWTPWFEGLGVMAEGTDPKDDEHTIALHNLAVLQLVDHYPPDSGDMLEYVGQRQREMEDRHSLAVQRAAPHRLRYELELQEAPYFAGYLLARMVMGTWRETLDRAVSGTEAYMLMLHATRYGSHAAIPPLDLPIEEFRTSCVGRMVGWIQTLARVDRDALAKFFAPADASQAASFMWREGRLVEVGAADRAVREDVVERQMRTWIVQALSSLCGALASADRTKGASPGVRDLVDHIVARDSKSLREVGDELLDALVEFADGMITRAALLPVGEVDTRFWLHWESGRIWVLLRTREKSADTGKPGYDAESFVLDDASKTRLRQECERLAKPRMRVTRMVDLRPGRFAGTHFFVFSYGDWLEVRPAGLATGAILDDPLRMKTIRDKLSGKIGLELDHRIAGAHRTKQWLRGFTTWWIGDQEVPLWMWQVHVLMQADEVLMVDRGAETRKAARAALAALAASTAIAGDIVDVGFPGLTETRPEHRTPLVEFLFRSVRAPDGGDWLDLHHTELEPSLAEVIVRSHLGWDVRPAG